MQVDNNRIIQQLKTQCGSQTDLSTLTVKQISEAAKQLDVSAEAITSALSEYLDTYEAADCDTSCKPNTERPQQSLDAFKRSVESFESDGSFSEQDKTTTLWLFSRLPSPQTQSRALGFLLQMGFPNTFVKCANWAEDKNISVQLTAHEFQCGMDTLRDDGNFTVKDKDAALWAFSTLHEADRSRAIGYLLKENFPSTLENVAKWAESAKRSTLIEFADFAEGLDEFRGDGTYADTDRRALHWAFSMLSLDDQSRAIGLLLAENMPNTHITFSKWASEKGLKLHLRYCDFEVALDAFRSDGSYTQEDRKALLWAFSLLSKADRQLAIELLGRENMPNTARELMEWDQRNC
jgi:hypothetical protein